ncbi:hypothetical protein AC579_3340 [Pseudocercospora musae]|uniref:Uncharacterized protein n=1 Tax=Pseudocercospora musae TaxID=113226 RepID=A0A139IEC0_9PEZI|nr:hypothetical protein AC579_3340 [Pseudocercospora musae]
MAVEVYVKPVPGTGTRRWAEHNAANGAPRLDLANSFKAMAILQLSLKTRHAPEQSRDCFPLMTEGPDVDAIVQLLSGTFEACSYYDIELAARSVSRSLTRPAVGAPIRLQPERGAKNQWSVIPAPSLGRQQIQHTGDLLLFAPTPIAFWRDYNYPNFPMGLFVGISIEISRPIAGLRLDTCKLIQAITSKPPTPGLWTVPNNAAKAKVPRRTLPRTWATHSSELCAFAVKKNDQYFGRILYGERTAAFDKCEANHIAAYGH